MRIFSLLLMGCVVCTGLYAQNFPDTITVFETQHDLQKGHGLPLCSRDARCKARPGSSSLNNMDYKVKFLRQQYFAFIVHDSLFVNVKPWKLGRVYKYAERWGNRLFFASKVCVNKTLRDDNLQDYGHNLSAAYILGGALGMAIATVSAPNLYYCYMIDLSQEEPVLLNDKTAMMEFLAAHPDLADRYEKAGQPISGDAVKYYIYEFLKRERLLAQ